MSHEKRTMMMISRHLPFHVVDCDCVRWFIFFKKLNIFLLTINSVIEQGPESSEEERDEDTAGEEKNDDGAASD